MLISAGVKHNNKLQREQESVEDTALSHCPLLRYPRQKATDVLDRLLE